MKQLNFCLVAILLLFFTLQCSGKDPIFATIDNGDGPVLGFSPSTGVKILAIDNHYFKDLNRNEKLDPYEDWRLSPDERAEDLSGRMSIEQIAGLMLYSAHQSLPATGIGIGTGTYNGKPFAKSNMRPSDLTDQQIKFLKDDYVRHILVMHIESPQIAAEWNNNMQAFLEGCDLGIPGNTSSDPRHSVANGAEFNAGGGYISLWPRELGLAATFDPQLVRSFGTIAAAEYRALGITTALSPQVDLSSEPRWFRFGMTFGENTMLVTDMGRAYIDGFQTSEGVDEIADGWGYKSVNAMVKHWPSGGAEEGGRDAHWAFGKFAVYPGNNFDEHLIPFVDGAFNLDGKTLKASAVMPYYTISYNQASDGTNYGNGFSKYIITDLLRQKYGYDGVVCTDWLITADEGQTPDAFLGKPWGVEKLSVAERHYLALMAGVDQFGGSNDVKPVLEAYQMGVQEHGEECMKTRFRQSAVRLLRNIFRLGLFENPYLDIEKSVSIVGNRDFMEAGYQAQLRSTVLLKNSNNTLPIKERKKVYIPKIYTPAKKTWWDTWTNPTLDYPVNLKDIEAYYDVVADASEADFAIVFVSYPKSLHGGYSSLDRKEGNNGYVPISLQYTPYTANETRAQSIAAGDPVVDPAITNRSYLGKTGKTENATDLNALLTTREMMKDKPVIAVIDVSNPMIFNEFERQMDAIVINFGSSVQVILDIISGKFEPSGLLPMQMPADMLTVEHQLEDVPQDMKCHTDTEGNTYDVGFGLNWNGVILDSRTQKYVNKKLISIF